MNAKQNLTIAAQKNVNTSSTFQKKNKKKSEKAKSRRGMFLRKDGRKFEGISNS